MWISFRILAASFKCSVVLECVIMAHLVKRAIDVYPVIESGQFLATRMMAICSHCLDYCTLMGMIYLKGVGYCSLFVAGSPEPYDDNGNSPTLLKQ